MPAKTTRRRPRTVWAALREAVELRRAAKAYLAYLWPHRRLLVVVVVLSLAAALFQMAEPLILRQIVDRVLLGRIQSTADRLRQLWSLSATLFCVTLASVGAGVLKDRCQLVLKGRVTLALRRALFKRFLRLRLGSLWELRTGGIASRLTGDVDTVAIVQPAFVALAVSVLRLALVALVLLWLNPRLAVLTLLVLPLVALSSALLYGGVRQLYRSLRADIVAIDGRTTEVFAGIRVVRAFRQEVRCLREYTRAQLALFRKELSACSRQSVLQGAWGALFAIASVIVVAYGGYLCTMGRASVGDIVAFQWYTALFLGPLAAVGSSFSEAQRGLAAVERVEEALHLEGTESDSPHAQLAPRRFSRLTFEHVEFEYSSGRPVLSDFHASIPAGALVALVGRSGAGKSTVLDLVARLQEPTRGRILLDGEDIRHFGLSSYRERLAVVQQDVMLFDGSIRDNIEFGRSGATDREIVHAAMLANAHEFIQALPAAYRTLVGERGMTLSRGQQQRIAIARAIVANAEILLLDEATNSLDAESERLIQTAMAPLISGRTTIAIAHRLSTIRRAHLILFIEGGRIIERGSHEELMMAHGAYARMVLSQDGEGEPALP